MPKHAWIIEVLHDLHHYSVANKLPEIAAKLCETQKAAHESILREEADPHGMGAVVLRAALKHL